MLTANRIFFFFLIACYVILMQSFILMTNKGWEILYFCYHRKTFWTEFFKIVTLLGEWLGLVGLAIYLLIKNRRALISALLAFVPINIFLQYIKNAMDYPRPLLYFKQGEISSIPDYIPLYKHSMPSGHTFTAFYCMTFLIFFYNLNRSWQALLFPIAILVGVSRMYLMCHFKEDVFVGSILGILAGVLSVVIYEKGLKRI